MGLPVVTVASGGLPVVESTVGGTPVSEAANLRGVPVTKVVGKPGMPVVYETIGIAPSGPPVLTTFATFDGTPTALVVMSNGNRTATHGSTGNGTGVCSRAALSSGKFYFEIAIVTSIGLANGIGIGLFSGGAWVDPTATAVNGLGVNLGTLSPIYTNNVSTSKNLGQQAINDVFGFAINVTNRLGWVRRNGGLWNVDAAANPTTGVNGVVVPAGALAPYVRFSNQAATDAFTGNFGQVAFAFTPPSGFSLGWGT